MESSYQPIAVISGDIVNSTPAIVGAPASGYDSLYGDDSYAAFRNKYAKRRNMVYVGANDGLLHAFNAGFFDNVNTRFTNTPTGNEVALFQANERTAGATVFYTHSLLKDLQTDDELNRFLAASPTHVALIASDSEPAPPLKVLKQMMVGRQAYYFVGQ